MDHLPEVDDPTSPSDDVECLVGGRWAYDRSGLTIYPLQAGLAFHTGIGKYARENYTLVAEKIPSLSAEKTAFMQSWLFFGVLVETFAILGLSLCTDDFVHIKNGCQYLTLRSLEKYILLWEALERKSEVIARGRRQADINRCLELADILAQENLRGRRRYDLIWSLSPQCALSIQLLHEALRHAWGSIYVGIDKLVTTSGAGLHSELPELRMRAAGWCPSEVAMLQNRFSVTGRYFASKLRRGGRAMNHASCTDTICNASQIDNSTYVTQHTAEDCNCTHFGVDPQKVGSVLKRGKIPRVLIISSGHERDQVDIQIIDSGPYIAISHVWAHGLGNAQSNSLPLCQLLRIQTYIEQLCTYTTIQHNPKDVAIWIDTLGVPLLRDTRKLALKLLPRTYEESTCCLVLDEELCQISRESTLEELCLRLVFSIWARRLWTFQEGIVTWNKLYIQFKEGPTRFGAFRDQNKPLLCSSLRLESVEEAKSTLPRVEDVRATGRDLIDKLTEACKYRTTSRMSDQTFCLAAIAGLDVNQIVDATTHEEKMRIFLLQIKKLSGRVIFFKGPKMTLENFSWAPLSFLNPEKTQSFSGVDEDEMNQATCTPDGLQGHWPGFSLVFPQFDGPGKDLYYFRFEEFWVIVHSIDTMQAKIHGSMPNADDIQRWRQVHLLPQVGLLVHSLDPLQKMGLIVEVKGEDRDVMIAKAVLTVSAMLVPIDEVDIFDASLLDPDRAVEIRGTSVVSEAVWNLT